MCPSIRLAFICVFLALFSFVFGGHYDHPRNSSVVQELRRQLLTNLDHLVPPSTNGVQGIQIGIQYRFFKIIRVDLASGQLELKVWRRMRWIDDRLSWNASTWDGITQIMIHPGDHSKLDDNMWTPQVVLYNGITPQKDVMEIGAAWVNYDGSVFYSVPGIMDVTCRFSGLQAFPYDELSCPIEIASWSYSDLVTNLTFMMDGDCADLSAAEMTAGASFQEYQLLRVECSRHETFYPCCGDEPFSRLVMRLFMKRASVFYLKLIELPGILLTLLSFGTFWLDAGNVGERLGFCSAMLLATQLLMLISSDVLPVCGELLWIELLNYTNFCFCMLALACSCFVVHLTYREAGGVADARDCKIDEFARWIIPSLYVASLAVVYNTDLSDDYQEDGRKPMFQGIKNVSFRGRVVIAPILLIMLLTAVVVKLYFRRLLGLCEQHNSSEALPEPAVELHEQPNSKEESNYYII